MSLPVRQNRNPAWEKTCSAYGRMHQELKTRLKTYEFESILLKDKQWDLELGLDLVELNEEFIRFRIPEVYSQLISKKILRVPCHGIRAQMFQNSVIFDGTLIDFCATEFSIKTRLEPPQTSQWLNPNVTVNILLSREAETLFSGECKIVKETSNGNTIDFLLKPTNQNIQRFKTKKIQKHPRRYHPCPHHPFHTPINRQSDMTLKSLIFQGLVFLSKKPKIHVFFCRA